MALLDVQGLEKTYEDGTRALRGVSFSVEKGEFVAVMGPSGSGKSTLLHMLGFLDRQSGGTYTFEGRSLEEYGEERLARVRNEKFGFVFQMFNLLPRTTVEENVRLPLMYSGVKESLWPKLVGDAVEAVGLSHRASHLTSQLSGGERQRTAIARALVTDPEVVFADEPTGNLDSVSGSQIMEIFRELNRQGRTVLVITHETETATHAGRIIELHDGLVKSDTRVTSPSP